MTRGIIPKYPQKSDYLQDAKYSFDALGDKSFIKLKKIARHASFFINELLISIKKLLPFMYDNGLFAGSDNWIDGLEWLEQDAEDKVKRLDLDNTLILLTSALAKDDDKGANYWYRSGITAQLLKHLVQLRG